VPTIVIETLIQADAQRCFDLARDVEAHAATTSSTRERVVNTPRVRLELGDEVTFEAAHLGVRWRLTSKITEYQPPRLFVDTMVQGPFQGFEHRHEFQPTLTGTLMLDHFTYKAPLGILGQAAEFLFLTAYLERFLRSRANALKVMAEASSADNGTHV